MTLDRVTKEDKNIVELEMTFSAEEFEQAVAAAYKKNVYKMNVPGFRRGKAPRRIIEKMYGAEVFHDDAINAIFPKAYDDAVKETGIIPVDRPNAEPISNDENGFKIKVRVTVKPEVSIGEYKGIKIDKAAVSVTEADVENELKTYQKRQARTVDIEEDVSVNGDKVNFDFEGFVDGIAFDGGKAEKYTLTLGSGQFIPGFEDQMLGKKAGDEFSVNVTFPEDYNSEELKGKDAEFKVKIHSVKREELPEIDDELAKDVSDFDTLAEFKTDLEKKIADRKNTAAENGADEKIFTKIAELCQADIPDCMIESEIDASLQNFERRMSSQGINMQQYMQYTGQTIDSMRASMRSSAENEIKIRLALEKIAELEGIIVEQEDIDSEYKKFADEMKVEVEKIISDYATENITKDLTLKKAFETVKNNAEITVVEETEKTDKTEEADEEPNVEGEETVQSEEPEVKTEKPKKTKKPAKTAITETEVESETETAE